VIGFDFAVREGFLSILGDPPARTEHDRLADLSSASMAPASPVLGRVLAALAGGARAVAEGSDAKQARAALLALEFPTLVVTAERRYPQP
jgi:hypothetical protein